MHVVVYICLLIGVGHPCFPLFFFSCSKLYIQKYIQTNRRDCKRFNVNVDCPLWNHECYQHPQPLKNQPSREHHSAVHVEDKRKWLDLLRCSRIRWPTIKQFQINKIPVPLKCCCCWARGCLWHISHFVSPCTLWHHTQHTHHTQYTHNTHTGHTQDTPHTEQ